ncbi:hypothetical protein M9Y10_019048 [Tritrichomonas musculus]|uniref:Uncharacterized protein n=1 Tax=Tritrichomonas musculus TaxID=1915356 RepID=A0ABR2HIG5_9EUKA
MDGERDFLIGAAPLAPRKRRGGRGSTGRASIAKPKDGQLSLQYFSQLLDIDTICSNALRSLRSDDKLNDQWTKDLLAEEWKFKFDVPISTKY